MPVFVRASSRAKAYTRSTSTSTRSQRKFQHKGAMVQRLNKVEDKLSASYIGAGMKYGFGSERAQARKSLRQRVINRRRFRVMFGK